MNYQKSGIIIFKKKENKYYFLLGKNNLNLLNSKNNLFSDIGGLKGNNDFNAKDTASRLFYENTCGLLFSINELKDKIMGSFDNPKYNYTLNFIHSNIDDNILHNINQIRSYLNTVIQSNGFNTFEKKEITRYGVTKICKMSSVRDQDTMITECFRKRYNHKPVLCVQEGK